MIAAEFLGADAVVVPVNPMSRADELGHPLRAEALACRQGNAGWVLVTADAIGFPCDLVARVRPRIAAATGLVESGIVLAATHTHSAPSGLGTYHADLERVDHQYRERTEDSLERAVPRSRAH